MTTADYQAIANSVSQMQRPPHQKNGKDIAVTDLHVKELATQMHLKGYNHTPESIQMCEEFLRGNGLYVKGPVGVGKTYFFRILGNLRFSPRSALASFTAPSFYVIEMPALGNKKKDDIINFLFEHKNDEVLIDDIGAEPLMSDYAVKFEPLPLIVAMREKSSKRTHITTNLTETKIADRYGVRIVDRLRAFGVPITFSGESQRTASPYTTKPALDDQGYHILLSAAEVEEQHQLAEIRMRQYEYDD